MTADGFALSIFGLRIAVLTDCPAAWTFFDRHLLPWLPRGTPDPEPADLNFRISRNNRRQGFDAYAGGRLIASNDRLPVVFGLLQNLIDERVVSCQPDTVAVHSGVVAWNGRVVLLPGASRAGKTTLVMELLKRGAVYYSDEYALLDSVGRVHPYPRALMLRDDDGWPRPTLPSEWNAATADSPAPVRLIVSAEWVSGKQWTMRPIPQSEALLLLLRNTPQEMASAPEMLRRVQRAVSNAACYAGVRGEAGDAASHVIELIAGLR